jgi:proteasome accessory factor C
MVNRVTPMEKASRLLDLVPYLYANQGVSIEKLSSDFKITREETLSDLNTLWMCGESRFDLIELEFESGFVYIRNAQAINIVRSLSTQESLSIILGLELLKDEFGDKRPDLISEIESIKSTLTPGLSSVVAASAGIKASLITAIDSAISARKNLQIDYHSVAEDKHSSRLVVPIEKIRREGHDFLIAFCSTANAKRSFRLDRISTAEVLESEREAPEEATANSETIIAKVKVHGNSRHFKETFSTYTELGDGEFEVEIFSPRWLIREVIASRGELEILEPLNLRQELLRLTKVVRDQYR